MMLSSPYTLDPLTPEPFRELSNLVNVRGIEGDSGSGLLLLGLVEA